MKYIFLYAAILNIFIVELSAQTTGRNVAWTHGFGDEAFDPGEIGVWDIYQTIFEAERQMESHEINYGSGAGIETGSIDARARFDALTTADSTDPTNLGIGHSMGSLIMRDIDRDFAADPRFGGIITVGGPNEGAHVLNSIDNGDADRVVNDAIRRGLAGPLSELSAGGLPLLSIANGVIADGLQDLLIGNAIQAQANNASGRDMMEGSAFLETGSDPLNAFSSTTPTISIWGNEESPVHWRLASSMASNGNNDNTFVILATGMEVTWTAFAAFNAAKALIGGISCFFFPPACAQAVLNGYRAVQWNRGRTWLRQSESLWLDLLDCNDHETTTTVTQTVSPYQQYCGGYITGSPQWIDCIDQVCFGDLSGPQCAPFQHTITFTSVTDEPSDGLLCRYTQILDGLPGGNVYEALGVNHREETNTTAMNTVNGNDEIGDIFNLIWDRIDIFETPVR